MNTSRPLTLISATVLLNLLSLFNLSYVVVPPLHWNTRSTFIYSESIVFGVVGLMGAFGLWTLKRWGWLLTSILTALSLLIWTSFLVLTVVLGDTLTHVAWALGLAICSILLLVLVVLPATRKAVAAAGAPVTA